MPLGTLKLEPGDSTEQSDGGEANGIIYTTPRSIENLGAHLKCLYAYSMKKKTRLNEALILCQCYDVISVSEAGGMNTMTGYL